MLDEEKSGRGFTTNMKKQIGFTKSNISAATRIVSSLFLNTGSSQLLPEMFCIHYYINMNAAVTENANG